MRRFALSLVIPVLLLTAGCMISEQVGERTHVNSPPPEEITFHYDTQFNKVLLFGRSAALILITIWAFAGYHKQGANMMLLILGVAALIGGLYLFIAGYPKVFNYRIHVGLQALHLNLPSEPQRTIEWREIEALDVEGMAYDVTLAGGKGEALKWHTQWEDLTLELTSGSTIEVDLRPLSVEQRGVLWRAICEKSGLETEMQVVPASHRR